MQQRKLAVRNVAAHPVQVIAVTSGKGGTGKTTVAVNLATALAQSGKRVLLFDGDLGLANVDVLLGLTPKCTVEQVLEGRASPGRDRGRDPRRREGHPRRQRPWRAWPRSARRSMPR